MNRAQLADTLTRIARRTDTMAGIKRSVVHLALFGAFDDESTTDRTEAILDRLVVAREDAANTRRVERSKNLRVDPPAPLAPSGRTFERLASLAMIEKGATGIQRAKPGSYPLVVTAEARGTCDHYDFEGPAAIVPLVSSTGHGHASIQRLHYQEGRFALGSILCAIRPLLPDLLSARFLYEYLTAFKDELLVASMVGTANVSLTLAKVGEVPIPIVPVEAQRRVEQLMALIDDLEAKQTKKREVGARFTKASLDALTTAEGPAEFDHAWKRLVENWETVLDGPEKVGETRRAVLGLACGGWLSAKSRQPHWGSGHRIVDAILAERRTERARLIADGVRPGSLPQAERTQFDEGEPGSLLPESWARCGIDDLLACVPNALKAGPFGSALTKSMYVSRGYKVYGQEQVISGDHRVGSYYVDERKFESLRSCAVSPGDMLISLMGTIGKVLILPEDCEPGIINPRLLKVSLNAKVSKDFVCLCLQSPQSQRFLAASARGVAMDGLNIGILRALPLPLPPYEEQKRIVAKVDQLMALCDQLEAALRRSDDRASKLVGAVVEGVVGC